MKSIAMIALLSAAVAAQGAPPTTTVSHTHSGTANVTLTGPPGTTPGSVNVTVSVTETVQLQGQTVVSTHATFEIEVAGCPGKIKVEGTYKPQGNGARIYLAPEVTWAGGTVRVKASVIFNAPQQPHSLGRVNVVAGNPVATGTATY